MYDRCELCRSPLRFYGISIRPHWLRWLQCPLDDTFFATTDFGADVYMTKRLPTEAYFMQFRDKRD